MLAKQNTDFSDRSENDWKISIRHSNCVALKFEVQPNNLTGLCVSWVKVKK